jgi:protein-S-isoprenylcysteine O-methyltransferase Ste14
VSRRVGFGQQPLGREQRPPGLGQKLPALGPRGEGWFAAQIVLFALIAYGAEWGGAWAGWLRGATVGAGVALAACGALLAFRGLVDLGRNLTPFPAPLRHAHLVDCGAYSLVRHPIYGGLIIGATGWGLGFASPLALAGAVLLAGFFDLKSRREEVWLAERYPDYPSYRARTRKMLPWVY